MQIRMQTYAFVDRFFPHSPLRRHGDTLEDVQKILARHDWNEQSAYGEVCQQVTGLTVKW